MSFFHFKDPDIVFIHTLKTAGKSIRAAMPNDHHSQFFGHYPKSLDDVFSFAVVRHPIDRFLSAVQMFKYGSDNNQGREIISRLPDLTIEQALDVLEDPLVGYDRTVRTPLGSLKHHLIAQTHPFVGLQHANEILRFENISEEFENIRNRFPSISHLSSVNTRKTDVESLVPTSGEMQRLMEYYKDDFEQLGYEPERKNAVRDIELRKSSNTYLWNIWPFLYGDSNIQNAMPRLPDVAVDLQLLADEITPTQREKIDGKRYKSLRQKFLSLQSEFSGKSRLSFLLGCTIVVLRRDPSDKAAYSLFHRIMNEQTAHIVGELNLRWLISVCDTYVDFGSNPAQIALGFAGAGISNTVKLYETERIVLSPPRHWPPSKRFGHGGTLFDGMETFSYPQGDMINNLLERAFKAADQDDVSGAVLLEIIARLQYRNTAFRRLSSLSGSEDLPVMEDRDLQVIRDFIEKKTS